MAIVKPFICIRPNKEAASLVAALPYDVYSRKEAKEYVQGKPLSFLNIDRPETQYDDDFDMYSQRAYDTARDMLKREIEDGTFIRDADETYYIYEETVTEGSVLFPVTGNAMQTGIVACCAIDDYKNGVIKKHENTRAEKELDRINHIRTVGAQTGPIFLAYRDVDTLTAIIQSEKKKEALYDFISDDGIHHRVWKMEDSSVITETEEIFAGIDNIYIADGHHRAASACKVGGTDTFMAVLFAESELRILPYNRVVKDLFGHSEDELFSLIGENFDIKEDVSGAYPDRHGSIGMYISGKWYTLTEKPELKSEVEGKAVESLDVAVLQNYILDPILGIRDPKTDNRINFAGGIRGSRELEKLVDSGEYRLAFSMYPTQMNELFSVADAGLLMPPKSTWFEPKLRSGLFIHEI